MKNRRQKAKCKKKIRYSSLPKAMVVKKRSKPVKMWVYRCQWCKGWHLGTVKIKRGAFLILPLDKLDKV